MGFVLIFWIPHALQRAFLFPQNPKTNNNNKINNNDNSQPFPLFLQQVFHDAVNNTNNKTKEEEQQQVHTFQSAVCTISIKKITKSHPFLFLLLLLLLLFLFSPSSLPNHYQIQKSLSFPSSIKLIFSNREFWNAIGGL